MNLSGDLAKTLLYQSENEIFHDPYARELEFYNAVKQGDLKGVEEHFSELTGDGKGKLSDNITNNLRYHFIVSVAMITRFCMEGGMPSETAYTLSDLYIRKADKIHSESAIKELHRTMVYDFAERMGKIHEPTKSKVISLTMEYINKNIRSPIQLEEVAHFAGISPSYLSTLFKKETGETLSNYIQRTRVEEAKNMLKFTDTEFIDISNYLCFSSHSHFIAVFKKYEGITPKEYRNKYYRKNFSSEEDDTENIK